MSSTQAAWPDNRRGEAPRERYPPPRLSRFGVGWRYAAAITNYVLGVLALLVLAPAAEELGDPSMATVLPPTGLLVVDVVLGLAALFVIRLRRRRPLLTLLIACAMAAVSQTSAVIAIWALISLATHRRLRDILIGACAYVVSAWVALALWLNFTIDGLTIALVGGAAVLASTAAYIALGLFIGARRDLLASMTERAETAEREQELRVLQGQATERNRIAREMHDVLAHRMSLVSMHAGALAYRSDLTPEQTREIAATIQENAHASLTELRAVLGSLREANALPELIEKPQPRGLAVEDLVAEARSGGAAIDFTDHVERRVLLPAATARHGYRIVQEALTNARKHAPGRRVTLAISGAPGAGLTIAVRNPVVAAHDDVPGSGLGLVGLRERVDLTGGRMTVRTDADYFDLEVWLPW